MRGMNTLQNIDVARRELSEILANTADPRREQDTRLQTAFEETQDSIEVLNQGSIFPTASDPSHRGAQSHRAGAISHRCPTQRRTLIQQAIAKLDVARNAVATIAP